MSAELDKHGSVSFRAVAIGLLLIPFNSYWIYMAESIKYTGHPTCMSFFYNAVTILVLMLGLNRLVRRVSPGRAFSRGEMLTVYVMVALGSVPASHDMLQILIPGMVYPQLAGAPGDLWWQEYVARLPWWLSVQGNVAKGFVAGGESLYNVGVIRAWLIPACAWIAFLVTLLFVMSCLAVLLRRQWTENEKLTFPIAQVPLEMTSEKLYVIGGWDTSDGYGGPPVGTNEVYDPATNTWATKAPMPVPVRGAACAAIDGKIYVAGGSKTARDVPDYDNTLQIYDTATDTWSTGPPMPTPRDLVTGFAAQGRFHVMAGTKDNPENPGSLINTGEHEVYDPATNQWTTLVPPGSPWPLADSSAAVVRHDAYDWVYFANGWWAGTQMSLAARWNSVSGGVYNDQWYPVASLPVGGNSGATIITVTDGTGAQWPAIFGGHFGPVGYYNKVFVYHDFDDPVFANRWLRDTAMPYGRGGRMAVAQIGDYVYVAAGMGPLGLAYDTWRTAVGSGLPMEVSLIREAISQPNATRVSFTESKVVTRVYETNDPPEQHIWIEESDRAAALRVGPVGVTVNPGNKVLLSGRMATDPTTGERILNPTSITVDPAFYDIPEPIGINNRSFMGGSRGSQPGRPDGVGLNNLGMLARIYGRVTAAPVDSGLDGWPFFYVDDGSNLLDGTTDGGQPNVGIRVYHWWYVNPPVNSYVSATGIISCEKVGGALVPILLSDELTMSDGGAIVEYD